MLGALAAKIAHVQALRRCRSCGQAVPPDAILCACRIAAGELPHTEWPRDLKRYLCVRKVEHVRELFTTDQAFWERMARDLYCGTWRGEGRGRVLLPMAASIIDVFPHAAGDAALWAASGYPTTVTI